MRPIEALLEIVRDEGVTRIFGNPGTTELPLMDALAEAPDLRYVLGLQEASVVAMFGAALERYGRLDVLHNNAADLSPATYGSDPDFTELDIVVWDRAMAVNARGVMLGIKHAVPAMRAGGGGAIVNTASVAGIVGEHTRGAYGSSKAAVIGLTHYAATMYGGANIRCNAVAPGLVLSDAAKAFLTAEQIEQLASERALAEAAEPEDIAAMVAFLASDEARCITGQVMVVDSGSWVAKPRHTQLAREHEQALREAQQPERHP